MARGRLDDLTCSCWVQVWRGSWIGRRWCLTFVRIRLCGDVHFQTVCMMTVSLLIGAMQHSFESPITLAGLCSLCSVFCCLHPWCHDIMLHSVFHIFLVSIYTLYQKIKLSQWFLINAHWFSATILQHSTPFFISLLLFLSSCRSPLTHGERNQSWLGRLRDTSICSISRNYSDVCDKEGTLNILCSFMIEEQNLY
jgi:hypothetical protein